MTQTPDMMEEEGQAAPNPLDLYPDAPEPTKRVLDAAHRAGLPLTLKIMDQTTHTVEDAAAAIGCEVDFIIKSILFKGKTTKKPILILASGKHRINEKNLAAQIGEVVEKADAETVRKITGFEIGGVAPIGLANKVTVLIDEHLMRFGRAWCAAGTDKAVMSVTPMLLARAIRARVVKLD